MTNKNFAILGFVLSFFVPLAGIIISAIAMKKFNESGETEGKGFATAGLVLGIIFMVLSVIAASCYACFAGSIIGALGSAY